MHHRYVLMFALETAGLVSVEGKSLRLDAGQALLILPYQFHHYIRLESDAVRWLFITFELQQGEGALAGLGHRVLTPNVEMREVWMQIAQVWSTDSISKRQVLPLLDQLLLMLSPLADHPVSSVHAGMLKRRVKDEWISKVESLVVRSIKEGWTLEEVAQRIGLSGRHLRTRFEAATGVSLSDYRSDYQLHHAIALMQNSDLNMGAIAESCGFNSQSAFNRFIKNKTGETPRSLMKKEESEQRSLM
jgi:AraC-like DNA-binding protein